MPSRPAEFSESEYGLVMQALIERYGHIVPIEQVEVELALSGEGGPLTAVPAFYWSALGAEFIVCKVGDNRFRSQFFYSPTELFGTGREVWDDLGDCVLTLLRLQADHASTRTPTPQAPATGDDYAGPLVV